MFRIGVIPIIMVLGLVLISLPGHGQASSNAYDIYFSSDSEGPGIYVTNTSGEFVRKLTYLDYGMIPSSMCISGDFSKIAYQAFVIGDTDRNIYLVDNAGIQEINLTTASGVSNQMSEGPHFFYSDWLYFASERSNGNGWVEAYRVLSNGSNVQPVSPIYSMWDPSTMSPDYSYLLLENADNWNLHSRLFIANPDGSNRRLIYESPGYFGRMRGSAWLPNSNKILFSGGTHDGNHGLFIINPDGAELRTLGFPSANNWPFGQYRWGMIVKFYTNDGQKVVFSANPTGNFDIYIQNIDGSGLTQLTTGAADDKNPIVTPDDQQILWIAESSGMRSLWIMNIDGSDKREIREDLGYVESFVMGAQESNNPPTAICKDISRDADRYCQAFIGPADIDGGSYDPDGDNIELTVDNPGPFSIGAHIVKLTVTDEHGKSDTCQATVTVLDKIPPVPDLASLPTVSGECSAEISVIPTATDNCAGKIDGVTNDPLKYTTQGTYTVAWTYNDGNGNIVTQTQTVVVKDVTAPNIENIKANPGVLWPPNHKMVPVTVNVTATDNCDPNLDCRITSVASNEPVDGLGDGDTSPDWEITGNLSLKLRAERSGTGNGRIYTITLLCKDASGNSSMRSIDVLVPHNKD